jgi:hypothetical protein
MPAPRQRRGGGRGLALLTLLLVVCVVAAAVTLVALSHSPPPRAAVAAAVARPDHRLTPGEAFPNAAATEVCTPGHSSQVRNVAREQYQQVYSEYHVAYPEPAGSYELDHLIPLELGGDNSNANLWPEPASPEPGFHQKDLLENALHQRVCSGQMTLADAQKAIAGDWYAAYLQYVQ